MEPLRHIIEEEESAEQLLLKEAEEKLINDEIEAERQKRLEQEIRESQEKNGPVPSRPESELKQIAIDLQASHIFTDRHMNEHDRKNLGMVFMVIMFMDAKDFYIPESIGMVYEYMSKAMPRSINGMPMFTSIHFLNIEDTDYVFQKAKEIDNMLKAL